MKLYFIHQFLSQARYMRKFIVIFMTLSVNFSLFASSLDLPEGINELKHLAQARIEYHSRLEAFFSKDSSCVVEKGSLFDAILTDIKRTKLNRKSMSKEILKASCNQHQNFRAAFTKLKEKLDVLPLEFSSISALAKEIKEEISTLQIQKFLQQALPMDRKTPGTKHLFRADVISKVHYNTDGSMQLEEKIRLPVFPTLPKSWQNYMYEELDDYTEFLEALCSSLNMLRRKILSEQLGHSSMEPQAVIPSFKDITEVSASRFKTKVIDSISTPQEHAPSTADSARGPSKDETVKLPTPLEQTAVDYPTLIISHEIKTDSITSSAQMRTPKLLKAVVVEGRKPSTVLTKKVIAESLALTSPISSAISLDKKLLGIRWQIASLSKVRSTDFAKFINALMELNLVKAKEGKSGLTVWFGPEEVHLFHRVHNRGFVMEDMDLKVAHKALNKAGLTLECFE